MKIALAPEAVEDLAAVVEYLVERNPQAAAATADAVFSVIDKLASGYAQDRIHLRRREASGRHRLERVE